MEVKIVMSDPRTGRAKQVEIKSPESEVFIGKKIGDKINGELIGMAGYEFEITGGSDKDGFPMRKDIAGTRRQKMLLSEGPGFNPKERGHRERKSVRGNTIDEDIIQINLKILNGPELKAEGENNNEEKAA